MLKPVTMKMPSLFSKASNATNLEGAPPARRGLASLPLPLKILGMAATTFGGCIAGTLITGGSPAGSLVGAGWGFMTGAEGFFRQQPAPSEGVHGGNEQEETPKDPQKRLDKPNLGPTLTC